MKDTFLTGPIKHKSKIHHITEIQINISLACSSTIHPTHTMSPTPKNLDVFRFKACGAVHGGEDCLDGNPNCMRLCLVKIDPTHATFPSGAGNVTENIKLWSCSTTQAIRKCISEGRPPILPGSKTADKLPRYICSTCLNPSTVPLKQCPCGAVHYCGKACQRTHWKAGHIHAGR